MDNTQAEPAPDAPAKGLSWIYSPWQTNWRRPTLALALCLAVAILGGWAFTVPPKHLPPAPAVTTPGVTAPEVTAAPEVSERSPEARPGQVWKDAREDLPWQVHWFWWSLASLLLLLGMTAPVYCTARYTLDAAGITVRFLGKRSFRSWQQYRNYYPHPHGVHVTTLPTPSRLDPFRGHFMQFSAPDAAGNTNRTAVLAFLAQHMTLKGVSEG